MIFAPKNEERSELITFVRVFIAPYNGEPRDTRHYERRIIYGHFVDIYWYPVHSSRNYG